jgi:hypothetical protein
MNEVREFKRKQYKIKVYGEEVLLTPPTFKEMKEFEGKISKAKDETKVIFDFLAARGLKREIAEDMYLEDLRDILDIFKQKKS